MKPYWKIGALTLAALVSAQLHAQTKPLSEGVTLTEPGFAAPGLSEFARERPAPLREVPAAKAQEVPKLRAQRPESQKPDARTYKASPKNVIVTEASHEGELELTELPLEDHSARTPTTAPAATPLAASASPVSHAGATIFLKPGETASLPIAVGVLNRIVTPFAAAAVDTVSDVQVKTAGSVVLVAAADTAPASIIVREKTAPEHAIILTLVPQKGLAARDVKISAAFPRPQQDAGNRASAEDLERGGAHPLAVRLKNVMRDLAQGRIPAGHSLEEGDGSQANCLLPGVHSRLAQVLAGSNYAIKVYALRNVAGERIEVDERGCSERHQLASAVWPLKSLERDEQTELFVIEAPQRRTPDAPQRPSTLR